MTHRLTWIVPALAGFFLTPALNAVQIKAGAIPNRGIFGVELAGTDSQFYARADKVLSVSWQEYSTGTWIVSEVVVDMENSDQQIRIYSLRVPGADDAAEAANRAAGAASGSASVPGVPGTLKKVQEKVDDAVGAATATMPVKSYPTTTHAKTVEYIVGSREELLTFYKSFRDLLCSKEVKVDAGSTVEGKNTAFGSSATPASGQNLTVNRLGGTVFTLKP